MTDMASLPDAEILAAVRAGNVEAYQFLYRRDFDVACRVARRIAPPSAVEDLVSESFAAVYAALRSGGGPTEKFRPYLLSTLRHFAQRWGQRRIDPASDALSDFDERRFLMGVTPTPEGVAFDRAEVGLVRTAFASLPEHYRYALWLYEVEREGYKAAATKMGISTTLFQSVLKSARKSLGDGYVAAHLTSSAKGTHPSAFDLAQYSRGHLRKAKRLAISDHIDGCVACALRNQEANAVGSTLRVGMVPGTLVPLTHRTAGRHGIRWPDRLSAVWHQFALPGAILAVAVICGVLVLSGSGPDHAPVSEGATHSGVSSADPTGSFASPPGDRVDSGSDQAGAAASQGGTAGPALTSPQDDEPSPSDAGAAATPGVSVSYVAGSDLVDVVAGDTVDLSFVITAERGVPAGVVLRIVVAAGVELDAPYSECDRAEAELSCSMIGPLRSGDSVRGTLRVRVIDPVVAQRPALSVAVR